jgi:DNA-binding SARP family transcriptional activator
MSERVRLVTFGGLSIDTGDSRGGFAVSPRRLALLAVIGASRHGVSRERLMSLFWPESSAERARNALNQALFVLRRVLPEGSLPGNATTIRVDSGLLWCDAAHFDALVAEGRRDEAVDLYRGPFLDGVHIRDSAEFNAWRDAEADRYFRMVGAALESLAEDARTRGHATAAVARWQQRAALDRGDSRVALRLMQAYLDAGDPTAALRHAAVHAQILDDEFGAPPNNRRGCHGFDPAGSDG